METNAEEGCHAQVLSYDHGCNLLFPRVELRMLLSVFDISDNCLYQQLPVYSLHKIHVRWPNIVLRCLYLVTDIPCVYIPSPVATIC
jgi:hypothetical protein